MCLTIKKMNFIFFYDFEKIMSNYNLPFDVNFYNKLCMSINSKHKHIKDMYGCKENIIAICEYIVHDTNWDGDYKRSTLHTFANAYLYFVNNLDFPNEQKKFLYSRNAVIGTNSNELITFYYFLEKIVTKDHYEKFLIFLIPEK